MILFFGTRPGSSKTGILSGIRCPFCQQSGTLEGYIAPHYVHLFWIPIIKLRPISEIRCNHCKKYYGKNDFTSEMQQALERLA
jgi:hypothetical protein